MCYYFPLPIFHELCLFQLPFKVNHFQFQFQSKLIEMSAQFKTWSSTFLQTNRFLCKPIYSILFYLWLKFVTVNKISIPVKVSLDKIPKKFFIPMKYSKNTVPAFTIPIVLTPSHNADILAALKPYQALINSTNISILTNIHFKSNRLRSHSIISQM